MAREYTEVKPHSELADDMNRQRAENVYVPSGQGVDAQGHDNLSDELDKGGLNHLDDDQMIAPVERERYEEMENGSGYLKPRTTNRWTSVQHRGR